MIRIQLVNLILKEIEVQNSSIKSLSENELVDNDAVNNKIRIEDLF